MHHRFELRAIPLRVGAALILALLVGCENEERDQEAVKPGEPLGALCLVDAECASLRCGNAANGSGDGSGEGRCAPLGMNFVPAGSFQMGSPESETERDYRENVHPSTISRPFFLSQTEVTQGQWKQVTGGANPACFQAPEGRVCSQRDMNDNAPVERVDWYAALSFANAVSERDGLSACYDVSGCADADDGWKDGVHTGCTDATFRGLTCAGYRLPTETEWEYAARAGTINSRYGTVQEIGWFNFNSEARPQQVAQLLPNAWGFYDMLGNVDEWTWDKFGLYPSAAVDSAGAASGDNVVLRGGGWSAVAKDLRAARRQPERPVTLRNDVGFRLARTLLGTLQFGDACKNNADCSSGFCATGPSGTDLDRCAPEGMNYLPSGTFLMGSPTSELGRFEDEALHEVTLSRPFFVGRTEVTQSEWKSLSKGQNPSHFQSMFCRFGGCVSTENANDAAPVESVDWLDAVAFANARSQYEGLAPCYLLSGCEASGGGWPDGGYRSCTDVAFLGLDCPGYRLLTEAEWEYAARGQTSTATYAGDLDAIADCVGLIDGVDGVATAALSTIAWYRCNGDSLTHAPGGKAANSFGLYDMLGNVDEWTGDWYDTYQRTVTDPLGAGTGTDRVFRGGSWYYDARYARAASRRNGTPGVRSVSLGFRLARSVPRSN